MNQTPTQVQHPWRTTLRTVVWLIIALAPTVPAVWGIIQDEVAKAGLTIPGGVTAVIAYGVAGIVAATGIVQRLVLIPQVDAVIAKIPGLAPQPAPDPVPQRAIDPAAPVPPSTTAGGDKIVFQPGNGDAPTTTPLA